eukprot:2459418-Rhodomonas_salina.2
MALILRLSSASTPSGCECTSAGARYPPEHTPLNADTRRRFASPSERGKAGFLVRASLVSEGC